MNDPYDCSLTFSSRILLNHIFSRNISEYICQLEKMGFTFSEEEKLELGRTNNPIERISELAARSENANHGNIDQPHDLAFHILAQNSKWTPILLSQASKKSSKISCFSEVGNSMLMWSHYTEKHKGFCIEYDFQSLGEADTATIGLYPVIYTNKLFDITNYLISDQLNGAVSLYAAIIKSKDWSYEKEWRLVRPFGTSIDQSFCRTPRPSHIYLGLSIDPANRQILEELGKASGIPVTQVNIRSDRYEIELR